MRFRERLRKAGLVATLAALGGAFSVSSAWAVTIGQVHPGSPTGCDGPLDALQKTVSSGNSYTVPSTGGVMTWTVTSWSTKASASPTASVAVKFFRKVGDPNRYMAVAHEGPHDIAADTTVKSFPANLQVKAGDVLGIHFNGSGDCAFDVPSDVVVFDRFDLADGATADFTEEDGPFRMDISAEITPTSSFTLGKVKAKKDGTATLRVKLPNPGRLTVSGKGVKGTPAASAAKKVAAGKVKVVIRAKGKNRRKLAENGMVTVKPKITFTPTGGTAHTEKKKVKLRRK
jgi:hypothetical protein